MIKTIIDKNQFKLFITDFFLYYYKIKKIINLINKHFI